MRRRTSCPHGRHRSAWRYSDPMMAVARHTHTHHHGDVEPEVPLHPSPAPQPPPPRPAARPPRGGRRSEEHTSELQSRGQLVCRLLLEKKKNNTKNNSLINKKKKKQNK